MSRNEPLIESAPILTHRRFVIFVVASALLLAACGAAAFSRWCATRPRCVVALEKMKVSGNHIEIKFKYECCPGNTVELFQEIESHTPVMRSVSLPANPKAQLRFNLSRSQQGGGSRSQGSNRLQSIKVHIKEGTEWKLMETGNFLICEHEDHYGPAETDFAVTRYYLIVRRQ